MNFLGTKGKLRLFPSTVAKKFSHINFSPLLQVAPHPYIFLNSAPIVIDVLRLLFQFGDTIHLAR